MVGMAIFIKHSKFSLIFLVTLQLGRAIGLALTKEEVLLVTSELRQ